MIGRLSILVAAFGILAAAAVAHGLRTDRWGASADLQAAVANLDGLPKQVGDWAGEDVPLSAAEVEVAQVAGYLVRNYTHKYTRETVTVMILCGRPGPVSVHTPEVCYAGAGFVPGPATKQPLPDGGAVWLADFVKSGATTETLRIRWGWSTDGELTASDSPRTDFAGAKALYKLYVIYPLAGTTSGKEPDLELLTALRPYLQKCLSLGT